MIPEDAPPATQQLCPDQPGSPSQPPGTTSCSLKSFQRLALPLEQQQPFAWHCQSVPPSKHPPFLKPGCFCSRAGHELGAQEGSKHQCGQLGAGLSPTVQGRGRFGKDTAQSMHPSPVCASIPSLCWGPAERGAVLGVGDEPIPGGIQLQAGLNRDPVLLCLAPLQGSVTGRGSDTGESQEELIPQPGRG